MRINHNIQALNTYKQLSVNQNNMSKHLERLSSGLRINRASDDAAGLAISEKMRSQIRGLKVADRNSLDGISMLQTAEGGLSEIQSILQRMRELSVQASNGTLTLDDRDSIQTEIDQLTFEIDRISRTTNFNGKTLLSGNIDATAFMTTASTQISHIGGGSFQGTITGNEEVYLSFLEVPSDGDSLIVDDVTINFSSGTVLAYDSATDSATIDVDGKTVEDILDDIKQILSDASLTDATAVDDLESYTIVDNALVIKDAGSGLDVEYNDPDYAPKPDEDLVELMQIGSNENEMLEIRICNVDTASLGIAREADHTTLIATPGENAKAGLDVCTEQAAKDAVEQIDIALNIMAMQRSNIGAYQNRLQHTINNLGTVTENLTAAESRIRDTDMAIEMANFTKTNIINQAATAMLAQANQMPQGILQLLQ